MSRRRRLPKPLSLAQLFEAPDDCHGFFGWLCGYSADEAFLNDALERFTRHTSAQRADEGKACLAVMLDPTNTWISPVDVPGVAHLRMTELHERPFKLLHAKVALLGFRTDGDADQWRIRLIVSTGNWTRATMEESLDLAWHTEIGRQDLRDDTDEIRAIRTNINTAWATLRWLRGSFDTSLLSEIPAGRQDTGTSDSFKRFDLIASQVRSARGVESGFFDNRRESLLHQLPGKVRAQAGDVRRNYLGMGSGFYQAPAGGMAIPTVLSSVADTLRDEKLLTREPEVDVFVNPRGCQAVAEALPAFAERGWTVRRAYKQEAIFGEGTDRPLHAKFILSGNSRERSNSCTSPWLYLGSGNLTGPGFTQAMSRAGGNFEAGVVLRTDELYWCDAKAAPPERVIPNVLPMRWDDSDILVASSSVSAGPPFTVGEEVCVAPPIACLFWQGGNGSGVLTPPNAGESAAIDVLDQQRNNCALGPRGGFIWPGDRPREVLIRWCPEGAGESRAKIPVLDEFGRISASPLRAIEIDEALRQLESFPMAPDDEDADDGESTDTATPGTEQSRSPGFTGTGVYPIRTMMQLVEKIAAQQTATGRSDWTAWCIRLEQTLIQTVKSAALKEFIRLGLNPLSPLRCVPFRPIFAEGPESREGRRYEDAMDRVEAEWGVAGLAAIGEDKQ